MWEELKDNSYLKDYKKVIVKMIPDNRSSKCLERCFVVRFLKCFNKNV